MRSRRGLMATFASVLIVALLAPASPAAAATDFTKLTDGNNDQYDPQASSDGRYISFWSFSTNLGATGNDISESPEQTADVFLIDTVSDTVTLVTDGSTSNAFNSTISADGSTVAYQSWDGSLGSGQTNPFSDVFAWDRAGDTTTLISAGLPNGEYYNPSISNDGSVIAFEGAPCCTDALPNGTWDIYVWVSGSGVTKVTSGNADSRAPSVSGDGSTVVFHSLATNLTGEADTNASNDVFSLDVGTGTITRVTSGGDSTNPEVDLDGDVVVFEKVVSGTTQIFRNTTQITNGNADSARPSVSDGGGVTVFDSQASNFFQNDLAAGRDIFQHINASDSIVLVSPGNDDSYHPYINAAGTVITFRSQATNLAGTNTTPLDVDIFSVPRSNSVPQAENAFIDVPAGAFYATPVAWLVQEGITNGTSPNTFSPNDVVTRAQMAAFMHRFKNEPVPAGDHSFTDVADGIWYDTPVAWLVEEGITNGTSPTTYGPNDIVTRAQMAAFLWRMEGEPAPAGGHSFTDVPNGAFYDTAVAWLVEQGITNGTSPTTYGPNDVVTRAQMAAFLYRVAGEPAL